MVKLLFPEMECKSSSDGDIWTSNVIPAFVVRPMPQGNDFMGYQLVILAKRTKKHVVFDAQVMYGRYIRTGDWKCRASSDRSEIVAAGRLNRKDNFLKGSGDDYGRSVSALELQFFENDVCRVVPSFRAGSQCAFQIVVGIARGRDASRHELREAYFSLSMLFNECGKSLLKWLSTY